VWPLDLGRHGDLIQIGARAVELWRGSSSTLELVAREPLPRRGSLYDAGVLTGPLQALAARVERGRAAVILESVFAPVLLADTGGVLITRSQIQALLRHRFGLAYGAPDADVASWKLRTDHRFGNRHALGFALPPAVELVLTETARSTKLEFTAWHPALAWSLARFAPSRRWPQGDGWWVWPEQDRSLLVRLARGRVEAFNPASPLRDTVAEVLRSIAIEGGRSGVEADARPIGIGHWQAHERPQGLDDRVRFFGVAGEAEASPVHASGRKAQELHAAAG